MLSFRRIVANGGLELANSEVTVTDIDGDGALTINDALCAAHESYFKGGAAAGYASEMSDYGLMLTKLWGIENGGSYGYYVHETVCSGDTKGTAPFLMACCALEV